MGACVLCKHNVRVRFPASPPNLKLQRINMYNIITRAFDTSGKEVEFINEVKSPSRALKIIEDLTYKGKENLIIVQRNPLKIIPGNVIISVDLNYDLNELKKEATAEVEKFEEEQRKLKAEVLSNYAPDKMGRTAAGSSLVNGV